MAYAYKLTIKRLGERGRVLGVLVSLLALNSVQAEESKPIEEPRKTEQSSEQAESPPSSEERPSEESPETPSKGEETESSTDTADRNEKDDGSADQSESSNPGKVETKLSPTACLDLHEEAQLRRMAGELLESESHLSRCTSAECPEVLRNDCSQWREELRDSIPQVVLRLKGDSGDLGFEKVFVDGERASKNLQGHTLRLNPGSHEIRVEIKSGESRVATVILSEGDNHRLLELDFRTRVTAAPAPIKAQPAPTVAEAPMVKTRPLLFPAQILTGVSVVSLGVGIAFGIDALSEQKSAEKVCAPVCDPSVSERVSRSATISDVAIGTAVVTAVGAAALYFLGPVVYVPGETKKSESSTPFSLELGTRSGKLTARGRF